MTWYEYTLRVAWNAPGRGYVPAPDGTRSVGVYTDSSATTQVALRQNGQPVDHVRVEGGRATFEADAAICYPDFGDGPFYAVTDDPAAINDATADATADAAIDRAEADGRLLTLAVANATYEPLGAVADEQQRADAAYVPWAEAPRAYASNGGLYQPTSLAMHKWRTTRSAVLAGTRQGHIAVVGDSIPFGAATTGASVPKYRNSWPGVLRSILAADYGDAGTGIVPADLNLRANPTWDPRWAWAGAVTDQAFGLHKSTAYRLDAVAGTYVEFTAECDEFIVYNLSATGGLNTATVDGANPKTFRNVHTSSAPQLEREPGYHQNVIVTRIPAGTLGTHTLRLTPQTTNAVNDMFLAYVEARKSGNGRFRVSNASVNGKSLGTLFGGASNNDETNGLWGLPLIDALKADLLVIALGINDWQGSLPVATLKSYLTTLIQRQRSTGTNSGGGSHPGGDAVLLWNPQPNLAVLNFTNPPWDAYREAYYEVANEQDCALVDLGGRWKDYATANGLGLYADTIHPSDKGALDIAPAVRHALFAA